MRHRTGRPASNFTRTARASKRSFNEPSFIELGGCFGYFAFARRRADLMLDPKLEYYDVAAIVRYRRRRRRCHFMERSNPLEEPS